MMHPLVSLVGLASAVAALWTPSSETDRAAAEVLVRSDEEPANWRDRGRPEVRAFWDGLEGQPAPAIGELSGWMNTEARSWGDLRGKVVLIDMWATWCGPCVAGIPHLKELHAEHGEDGLVVLGVHVARGHEKMEAYVQQKEIGYATAKEPSGFLSNALGVRFIPSYFVIDRSGTLRIAGANRAKLDEIVEHFLAEEVTAEAGDGKAWPAIESKELYASNDFRGKAAPAFEVETWLNDRPEMEGKVLLVDFWATWCGPCKRLIPEMNEWQERFGDDLAIVGVSDEKPEVVKEFLDKTEVHYGMAIDQGKAMKGALGVRGIPHVMLVTTDGIVRWQGFPGLTGHALTAEILEQVIELDDGVAARREAEAAKRAKKDAETPAPAERGGR